MANVSSVDGPGGRGENRDDFEQWKKQIREKGETPAIGDGEPVELQNLLTRLVSLSELMGAMEDRISFHDTHQRSNLSMEIIDRMIRREYRTVP